MAKRKGEVGYGIIGCGNIGPKHAAAIGLIKGARLIAVSDVDVSKALAVAATFNYEVPAYADFHQLLEHPGVDAVCLCVPSGMRREIGLACIKAGKHVMCEKPIEVTVERADSLIRAADKAGVLLGCIFQSRFGRGLQLTKKAITQGRFGKLLSCSIHVPWWRLPSYYKKVPWRGTRKLDGGGALMNQAIHQVDLAQWLLGRIVRVFGQTRRMLHKRIEMEDLAVAVLEFRNGALGTLTTTTAAWPGSAVRFEIWGTKGHVVLEDGNITTWEFAERQRGDRRIAAGTADKSATGSAGRDPIALLGSKGHFLQLMDFVRAIKEKRRPSIDGREARKAVAIARAIYKSAERNRPVAVSY